MPDVELAISSNYEIIIIIKHDVLPACFCAIPDINSETNLMLDCMIENFK
jgi:hypothetical protein